MEEPTTEHKILRVQNYLGEKRIGIWGNDSCERCGTCCYYFDIKETSSPQDSICQFLEINRAVNCEKHGKNKPKECVDFFCGAVRAQGYRWEMQRIAIDRLKTKKEQDYLKLLAKYQEAIQFEFDKNIYPLMKKCLERKPEWTTRDHFNNYYFDDLKKLEFEVLPFIRAFAQKNELVKLQKQCLIWLVSEIADKEFPRPSKDQNVWDHTLEWLCSQEIAC
jgi:hypothetical protein